MNSIHPTGVSVNNIHGVPESGVLPVVPVMPDKCRSCVYFVYSSEKREAVRGE